ncbi:helix-turn-helix domain-containing protein [Enterococcus mundtii]
MSELLFNRIKETAKRKKNMNVKEVGLALKIGENAIYSWKKSNPSIDKLQKIADFLDVSTDYLLGRTDTPTTDLSKPQFTIEEALASVMSSDGKPLTEHDRKVLTGIIEAYIENNSDAE